MPRVRSINAYQHVSDLEQGRIVTYRDCALSYRSIVARVGRDPMTVSRVWNRWVQNALNQDLGSFARQQKSTRTVRRRMQQHGLSARRPWQRLPLTLHHRHERLQWCDQRREVNGERSFSHVNPDSAYSIKVVASVFVW
ncbi:HTH_Tnp_Tc3_2 domain-containing protein [Trichonephila clavipes]|nr:HTH_Tnp_Tc3_2 domain-containing protein [Trichonephila clavipes]